jgi:hypothetical protein
MVPTMMAMMSFLPPPTGIGGAEIAVGAQMREGPGFDPRQHRMLEHALDVAGDIGGDDHDARRPH